jgi:hypothetical protein
MRGVAVRLAKWCGAAVLLLSRSLEAQSAPVRVAGIAFDSLKGEPLREAVVAIRGLAGSATTDERGRFSFDHVPPGRHTFVVQHPVLDTIGFSGLSRQVLVGPGSGDIRIGVPSLATLWRTACGAGAPPKDKALVFGTIRDIDQQRPVPDAFVDLTWQDLTYDKRRGLRQTAHRGATRSDSTGSYVVCGVPTNTWMRIDAGVASGASGRIDLPPSPLQVRRRDLMVGVSGEQDSTQRGTISGHLVGPDGGAFMNARIVLDDSSEVRSGVDGRFIMRNVRAGTRQVEVFSIGISPVVSAVDVLPGETSTLALQLQRVTTLDVVQVTGTSRGRRIAMEIIERKRLGFGHTMELGELVAHSTMETVFADLPSTIIERRGVDFAVWLPDGRGGQCPAQVWVDGARSGPEALNMIRPREVTAVEVYARPGTVPLKFRPVEVKSGCGVILVWTNWAFGR